ncbi:unnamed protein product, partial [marine sediment metagenome]
PPLLETKDIGDNMEHRKEYAEGETILCPKCGSDDLDCDEFPDYGKCNRCGQTFSILRVLVWEEN